ncbi:hypothetical protein ACJJTC_019529 [Scirpophaga incertulas]
MFLLQGFLRFDPLRIFASGHWSLYRALGQKAFRVAGHHITTGATLMITTRLIINHQITSSLDDGKRRPRLGDPYKMAARQALYGGRNRSDKRRAGRCRQHLRESREFERKSILLDHKVQWERASRDFLRKPADESGGWRRRRSG